MLINKLVAGNGMKRFMDCSNYSTCKIIPFRFPDYRGRKGIILKAVQVRKGWSKKFSVLIYSST